MLFPFVAVAALVVLRLSGAGRGPWGAVTVMALLLTGSIWASIQTGEQEEEVVEDIVGERVLHEHEEAAEGLLLGSLLLTVIALTGLVPGKPGRAGRYLSVPVGLIVLALALNVGASGGALVYEHGAASAYAAHR